MKLKTLKKKIRRLETRLQEGPKKLAKWKRKLEALVTANAAKVRRKSAARAAATRRATKASVATSVKPAGPKKGRAAKKGKRKLNLSPERRAQLAAAMKARWAARRATAETNPPNASTDRDFTLENVPQAP